MSHDACEAINQAALQSAAIIFVALLLIGVLLILENYSDDWKDWQ